MAKLKVWGAASMWPGFIGQRRVLVCATSQASAAVMVGSTLGAFRGWWGETGNAIEIATATEPGVWVGNGDSSKPSHLTKFTRVAARVPR